MQGDGWTSLAEALESEIVKWFGPLFACEEPAAALECLKNFKILAAVRKGRFGVAGLNLFAEQVLRKHGYIQPTPGLPLAWYAGRPVMITRNDYHHQLFNGDIGIALRVPKAGGEEIQVFFPDTPGQFKRMAPHQLPEHQTVYAMTVHKSQGSEFKHILLVLPDEDVPVLTRELIYTAVTRARERIAIWAGPELLARAVGRSTQRASGLRSMLWPG